MRRIERFPGHDVDPFSPRSIERRDRRSTVLLAIYFIGGVAGVVAGISESLQLKWATPALFFIGAASGVIAALFSESRRLRSAIVAGAITIALALASYGVASAGGPAFLTPQKQGVDPRSPR